MNVFQRSYKRFVVLLVVTLVVVGLALLFYGIINVLTGPPPPTCTDTIQNQGEEDVDCGGPCQECLLRTLEKIEVQAVNIVRTLPGFVDVVVWLENPNNQAGAATVSYVVSLEDGRGQITSFDVDQFLLPGELQFFVHQKIAVTRLPQTADVVISGAKWQVFDRQPQVTLDINNDVLFQSQEGWRLQGIATNESSFDLDMVEVVTLLRDERGDVVAAGSHVVRTLRSGEDRAFVVSWPVGFEIAPVTAQTKARTNIFSNNNILLEYGAGELQPFQQLNGDGGR